MVSLFLRAAAEFPDADGVGLLYIYAMHDKLADDAQEGSQRRLAAALAAVAVRDGTHPTPVPGVEVWRASAPVARHLVVYQPEIVIIGQGRKRGYLGAQTYHYDPSNYLVLTVPLPFECEVDASPEEPLLGVTVALEPAALAEMLLEMDEPVHGEGAVAAPRGIAFSPLSPALSGSVIRLLECLRSPVDSRVLGPALAREVVYRVLRGEQGPALRALTNHSAHFGRIARVLRCIHADFAEPLTTELLARRAGMSASVFHQNFKQVTATSPLQYLKQVCLHRARSLMAHDGCNASVAATRVGYESASQFGREFKRLFGTPPVQDAARLRRRLEPGRQPSRAV